MNLFSKKSSIYDLIHAEIRKCLKDENEFICVEFALEKLELQKQLSMLKFDLLMRDCEVIILCTVDQLTFMILF